MKILFITFLLLLLPSFVNADNQQLLTQLDSALKAKPAVAKAKHERIALFRNSLDRRNDPKVRLKAYNDIYQEYYVFNYDSAMLYVSKGLKLAKAVGENYYIHHFTLQEARLLVVAGLFTEAMDILDSVNEATLEQNLKFDYYFTFYRLYINLSEYCKDDTYQPIYRKRATEYLVKAMRYLSRDDRYYQYYIGEYYTNVKADNEKAKVCYQQAIKDSSMNSRVYAMSCYMMAFIYKAKGDKEKYEEYLIRSSIGDALSATKENAALQTLAVLLCSSSKRDYDRAQRYITESLGDAKFYNSRLRIIETSRNLPYVISQYQEEIARRSTIQIIAICAISLLTIGLAVMLFLFFRKNRRLIYTRNVLKLTNKSLADSIQKQGKLNQQLSTVNKQLVDTNKRRERLARLFIDLCNEYIIRLGNFQFYVKRKIKANQVQELLSHISSTRTSEKDAQIFYRRFDDAFLSLYPDFVKQFNGLLQEGQEVVPRKEGTLNTELRIFALVKLGIKDSSEISNLLFYSPQTIYNYRSSVKNRAKDRDNFEENVRNLCM